MRSQYFPISTAVQDEPSDGAFQMICTTLLGQPSYLSGWTLTEDGDGARATIKTSVEVTGNPEDLPPSTLYRIACAYVVSHLQGPSLEEAYKSLAEIHQYQVESERISLVPKIVAQPIRRQVTSMRSGVRQPIAVDE